MPFHTYFSFENICPDIQPITNQDQEHPDADGSPYSEKVSHIPATVLTYHYAK